MKAYYINLDRRTDRRQQFEATCRRAGTKVERFRPIDGRTLELPPGRGEEFQESHGAQDRSIYASLLSHTALIEKARNLCLPEVMIFEDDAVFPEWFVEETNYFLSSVPADWGMIYFGGHGWPRHWSHVSGPVLRGKNMDNIECYVLRNTVYDRVIGELKQAFGAPGRWADQVLRDLQEEIPTYAMLNPIVGQRADFSDNYAHDFVHDDSRCDIPGWFTDAQGAEYLRQVRRFGKPAVADLGTYKGRSTSFIAEVVQRRGGLLFCVDSWDCEPSVWEDFEWWMNATGLRECVKTVRMDAAEAAGLFADGHFDLVMHHAEPSYEASKREIQAWLPKVRSGGIMMGRDDTNAEGICPGVRRAVDEIFGGKVRSEEGLRMRSGSAVLGTLVAQRGISQSLASKRLSVLYNAKGVDVEVAPLAPFFHPKQRNSRLRMTQGFSPATTQYSEITTARS